MNTIFQLSQDIIGKIAAGEVIERPMYAVKELVENAIDAKADVITIHIEESGLRQIIVSDNGIGMSREDLEACFLSHTTSKIRHEEDLHRIKTLGFRGEALASIAAISLLTIKSRTPKSAGGTLVEIENNKLQKISPVGTPIGTIVTAENLFHNVPARKKFLKSQATEFRQITDIILHYALSFPEIHFVLTHNKKTVFDLSKKSTTHDRIKFVFGDSIFEHFLPVEYGDSYINIEGFVGKPQIASSNNQRQYLFVNKRKVSDKLISLAVKEAFGTLLPAISTPVFRLHLTVPYDVVDVNVHPRKEQVSFLNNKLMFDAIKQAVTQTLTDHNITFQLAKFHQVETGRKGETQTFAGKMLKETVLPWNRQGIGEILRQTPIVQLHNLYILVATKEGFFLIDQHAAHERILYEQFVKEFEQQKKKKENYVLKTPIKLDLFFTESQALEEYKEIFSNIGFELESFQGNTFLIRKVPILFKGRNIQKIIADMIADLLEDKTPKPIDVRSQRMLAFLSCRAAVKAGDSLTQSQCQTIIKQLEKTQNNATCPHGRPTKLAVSLEDLEKSFRRK